MRKIIIVLLTALSSAAMTGQTLTVEQCRQKALEHNKKLEKAQCKVEQTHADAAYYKDNFFPKIDVLAGDMYSWGKTELTLPVGEMAGNMLSQIAPTLLQSGMVSQETLGAFSQIQMPDQEMEFKLKNTFFASAVLTQPLYVGGKITAAYKMSRIGERMARTNVRLTESEVIVETDEAYMLLVKTQRLVKVANSYKALLDELQSNVDAAVKHGVRMSNDALKVQVKRNEVELNVVKAENACRLAKMNLCQIIGEDLNSDISVEESNGSVSGLSTLINTGGNVDLSERPETDLLKGKTELAAANVRIAASDYLPQIVLMGGYGYLNGMELNGQKLFDNGSPSVGVTVKIPVLEYFTQGRHKINSAKAARRMAELEQEDSNERMMLESTQCGNNLNEAILEVQLTAKSSEHARRNMEMSKKQYEQGVETLSDYLDAQAMWQQAECDRIEAEYKCFIANSKYLKSVGKLR